MLVMNGNNVRTNPNNGSVQFQDPSGYFVPYILPDMATVIRAPGMNNEKCLSYFKINAEWIENPAISKVNAGKSPKYILIKMVLVMVMVVVKMVVNAAYFVKKC
jgi:hypothetical protein